MSDGTAEEPILLRPAVGTGEQVAVKPTSKKVKNK
jgi:hypothetical protein